MASRCTISVSLVFLLATLAAAQTGSSTPTLDTIVSRMMAARQEDQTHMRPYVVKRNYQLLDKQEQPKAQVIASIVYEPPNQKQYSIESSSGGIGGKLLRDIVQKETETTQESRKEISPENYEFQLAGQETIDGHNCYVLALAPRRDEKELIRGKIWVDAADYRIHRLEGNPVKSPSWWIRDLHIMVLFASVDGMWLHTFTQAVADIRFKGKYVMESRDLEYRPAVQTAVRHHRNASILAGAAINP